LGGKGEGTVGLEQKLEGGGREKEKGLPGSQVTRKVGTKGQKGAVKKGDKNDA